ncbi:hypothetical protein HPB47_004945, partial [Ixodes persulcatus]
NCLVARNLSRCTEGSHYACVMEDGRGQCLPWDGRELCIGGKRARFTSESQCQKACYGDPPLFSTCSAELKVCPCGDHSRKLGWIWTRDSKCVSVPTQLCVNEGFPTKRACIATCVPVYRKVSGRSEGRLKGGIAGSHCTAVCEENLEEMGDNAALANEFELPFSDLKPTEREMLVRTQNSGLALYEGAPDLPPAPRSPPQSDSG